LFHLRLSYPCFFFFICELRHKTLMIKILLQWRSFSPQSRIFIGFTSHVTSSFTFTRTWVNTHKGLMPAFHSKITWNTLWILVNSEGKFTCYLFTWLIVRLTSNLFIYSDLTPLISTWGLHFTTAILVP
jgi:hypothetical protein